MASVTNIAAARYSKKELARHLLDCEQRVVLLEKLMIILARRDNLVVIGPKEFDVKPDEFFRVMTRDNQVIIEYVPPPDNGAGA